MLSNCGHDENGRYKNGQAGDQTGTEWEIKPWYKYEGGWTVVLRFENQQIAQLNADIARAAAQNDLIGYDQNQRETYWQHLKASNYDPSQITIACEADCSSGVAANIKAVGYRLGITALQNVPSGSTTSSLRDNLKAAGAVELTDSKYLTSDSYLRPGDILLKVGQHTATNLDMGSNANWGDAGFKKISISTTSSSIAGIRVCGNNVPVCSSPGDSRTLVGHLNDGNLLACDYRAWTNGSCFYHYADGWVDGKNLQGWVYEEGKWWYLIGNGTLNYPKNQFYAIDGNVYYFDAEGWMVTGWLQLNGIWYYMRSWGAIYRNEFFTDEGHLYYANADGSMFTGWLTKNGKKYYFRSWGAGYQNEKFIDQATGEIYYGTEDGSIIMSSWVQIDGKYYYFGPTGAAYCNKLFDESGNKYYCDGNGVMLTNCWKEIDSDWYYFRSWGAAINYGFWNDGQNTFYFGTDCKMKTGWMTIDGDTYYFRDWGAMLVHAWKKYGDHYRYLDHEGKYVPSKDTKTPDTSDGSTIYE